jgi:hypothetical protein
MIRSLSSNRFPAVNSSVFFAHFILRMQHWTKAHVLISQTTIRLAVSVTRNIFRYKSLCILELLRQETRCKQSRTERWKLLHFLTYKDKNNCSSKERDTHTSSSTAHISKPTLIYHDTLKECDNDSTHRNYIAQYCTVASRCVFSLNLILYYSLNK